LKAGEERAAGLIAATSPQGGEDGEEPFFILVEGGGVNEKRE
jgi:hypothetical protein